MNALIADARSGRLRARRTRPGRASWGLAVLTPLVLALTVGGSVVVARSASGSYVHDQAQQDARRMVGLAAPLVSRDVREGNPAAIRRVSAALMARVRDGSLEHIHLRDRDGRILWADQPSQIGKRFPLSFETAALFDTLADVAVGPALDRDELRGLATAEKPLEVHAGALDSDGEPFVLETRLSERAITARREALFMVLVPMALVPLGTLALAVLPLFWVMSRRVSRTRREHARIVDDALSAWHAERRRIAQDLHDGVVQNLSAVSYALPGVLDSIPDDPETAQARTMGRQLNRMLENDLSALRTLITDQLPDLEGDGMRTALGALAARAADRELEVRLHLDHDLRLDLTAAGLVYRVVREGLRNVEKHARARTAEVAVQAEKDVVAVRVSDDGQGLGAEKAGSGHVGLRLLAGLMSDLSGTLELRAGVTGGTVLEARFPRVLVHTCGRDARAGLMS